MGKALADAYPAARRVFDEADEALGFSLSGLCFEGPEDQLKLTQNTQPALLTVSIAALAVLTQEGFAPQFVAGHSLGEYSALVAAGSFGLLPKAASDAAGEVSRWCLVAAVAALGMKTSFGALVKVGWRPVLLIVGETAWIGALVLVATLVWR